MSDAPPTPCLKVQVCLFCYGGVNEQTHACLQRDIITALADKDMTYSISLGQAWGDALIDRCRAMAVEQFLLSDCDVMVMLDHDLEWRQGDILRLAKKAYETGGIVGAAVSKRTRGNGIASAVVDMGIWQSGTDRLVQATYVGAAFTAYPRRILADVMAKFPKAIQGWRAGFIPSLWPHATALSNAVTCILRLDGSTSVEDLAHKLRDEGLQRKVTVLDGHLVVHDGPIDVDYLSEDWAFCRRAMQLGYKCWLDLKPQVVHHGAYGYTIADAFAGHDPEQFRQPPKFSLLYATRGRAAQVLPTLERWKNAASGFHEIECVISTDDDDPAALPADVTPPDWCRCVRGPSRGCVDAYNRAAADAKGDVLIQLHDDLDPCDNWDQRIAIALGADGWKKPAVVHVGDGLDESVNRNPELLTVLVVTRPWYERCGYFWNPAFVSIGCDDHLTALAKKEGVVIEATDIVFKHRWEGPDRDETQRRSYDPRNWEVGRLALAKEIEKGLPVGVES